MTATETPDLALDAALLMRALEADERELRLKQEVRPQRDEAIGLHAPAALEDLLDRRPQIVVAHQRRNAAEEVKRLGVPFEERLLRLVEERSGKRRARVTEAQMKEMNLRAPAAQQHPCLAPVDLALHPRRVQLRHERLTDLPERHTALAHVAADLALRDLRAMLSDQALPHPPRRVTLLARRIAIGHQPRIDHAAVRTELRRRPLHRRALDRRHRRQQRLPHRPAMHPVALGQRPDRQPLAIAIAPDLLERFHPGTHPFRPHPLELHELATVKARSDGGGATSSVHTGATSDVHTQPRCRSLERRFRGRSTDVVCRRGPDLRGRSHRQDERAAAIPALPQGSRLASVLTEDRRPPVQIKSARVGVCPRSGRPAAKPAFGIR